MYRAKALGKARYEVFTLSLRDQAISRLKLENDLRHALERSEFHLHYQPIIDIQTNHLVGFEALLRWNHSRRGILPPLEFIPLAEESGLIVPIGNWVLMEACIQLKNWQDKSPAYQNLTININISGKQFAQPDFYETVEKVLMTSGLRPESLKLEITESILVDNYQSTGQLFAKLSKLGVQLEIDDFGTGYSSLGYLQNFPIRTIKIDKSFIKELDKSKKGVEIIRAMISMARDLGMETIAEGVETEEQFKELQRLMCHSAQGYLISHPLDPQHAEEYMTSRTNQNIKD